MIQQPRIEPTAIELARDISQIYEAAYAKAKTSKHAVLGALGWPDEAQPVSQLAVALTQIKIESRLGQRFRRSAIFRYIGVANQLSAPVQALARTHRFSLRVLVRLSRLTPEQQHDLAITLANKPSQAKRSCLLVLEQVFKLSNDLGMLLAKGALPIKLARHLEVWELKRLIETVEATCECLSEYRRCATLLLSEKAGENAESSASDA